MEEGRTNTLPEVILEALVAGLSRPKTNTPVHRQTNTDSTEKMRANQVTEETRKEIKESEKEIKTMIETEEIKRENTTTTALPASATRVGLQTKAESLRRSTGEERNTEND